MMLTATCTMRLKTFYQSENKNTIVSPAGPERSRNILRKFILTRIFPRRVREGISGRVRLINLQHFPQR